MRIFTQKTIKEYIEKEPKAKTALQEWKTIVEKTNWANFAELKNTFNSVDSVGNQRYVFNIKGNDYRLVAIIKFNAKLLYIRFIGSHKEYDKIDCKNI